MFIPWIQFVHHCLLREIRYDRKFLTKKRDWKKHFQSRGYYVQLLREEFESLNLLIYPDEDELLAYIKQFCANLEKIPRKIPDFADEALFLIQRPNIRRTIEILLLLKYLPVQIWKILLEKPLVETDFQYQFVEDYIQFFFNIPEMSPLQKDMFFAKARSEENLYYAVHCGIYYGTITEDMALASLGIDFNSVSNAERLDRLIRQLSIVLENLVIKNDVAQIYTISQCLGTIVNSLSKLGVEQTEAKSLSHYVEIVMKEREKTMTLEEIREHNARLDVKNKRQNSSTAGGGSEPGDSSGGGLNG